MSVAPAEGPLCLSGNRSVEWNTNFVIKYSFEKTLINVERSIWLNILAFRSFLNEPPIISYNTYVGSQKTMRD